MRVVALPISRAQQSFRQSSEWLTGFCGGRGAGKTKIGAIDIKQKARRNQPWMAVSPDNNMIRETTLPTFLETVRFTGDYIDDRMSPVPRVWFRTQDGGKAEIVFKGAEKPDKLRGPNKAGIWFDEASIITKDAFDIAIACCRYRGKMGPVTATFTPRGFKHWTFESFYDPVDDSLVGTKGFTPDKLDCFQGRYYRRKEDSLLVRCATRDNPFAPPEYVKRISANYSTSLALQELEGDFVEISGLIFKREWFLDVVPHAPAEATRVRYIDKAACLLAGTLVTTARGDVPIERVTTNDKVLTRDGWKQLSFAGPTKVTRELVTVLFEHGRAVTCTPEHRVWCENVGDWIEAKDLNGYSKCVTHFTTTEEDLSCREHGTRTCKKRTLTAYDTQETQAVEAPVVVGISTHAFGASQKGDISTAVCTETFGKRRMVLSPVAIISTTLTETGTTTTSKIFSASAQANTEENTRIKCQIQKLLLKHEQALLGAGKKNSQNTRLANGVETNTDLHAQHQNSAETLATNLQEIKRKEPNTLRRASLEFASHAESAGKCSMFTEPKSTVQGNASGNFGTGKQERGAVVYDLTVKNGPPEFFANGILVHNSADSGCFTVALLMARDDRGIYYIEDIVRGQWSAHERNKVIYDTCKRDSLKYGGTVLTYIEQEGGGDGKTVADQLITMLSEFPVYRDVVGGGQWKTKHNLRLPGDAKVRRAMPFAAQAEAGNVRLVEGNWHADYMDELCLDANSRIATNRGLKPIAEIRRGDSVWTRKGLRRVIRSEMTSPSAKLWKVKTQFGELLGTANHPVWVDTIGFIPIRHIKEGHALLRLLDREGSTCIQQPSPTQKENTLLGTSAGKTSNCIDGFMRRCLGSILALTSTTRTETRSTIALKILRRFLQENIRNRIPKTIFGEDFQNRGRLRNVPFANENIPLEFPADLSPALCGVPIGGNSLLATREFTVTFARIANWNSLLRNGRRPIAVGIASQLPGLERSESNQGNVLNARKSSIQNRKALDFALDRVVSVEDTGLANPVFNLLVDGEHEFFANGILTHNCMFPEYAYADQVDASSGSYNTLQKIAPTFGVHAERGTVGSEESQFGQTAGLSGDSISRWDDLPWNQHY